MIGNRLLVQSRPAGTWFLTMMLLLMLLPGCGSLRTSAGPAGDVQELLTQLPEAELFGFPFEPTLSNEQRLKLPAATPKPLASALCLLLLVKVSGVNHTVTSFPISLSSSPAFHPRPPPCT